MVAIVHKVRWVKANSKKFNSYVDYIDREEAVRKYKNEDFSLYNDYMGNPSKLGTLFTKEKDFLNESEKKNLKQSFKEAQNKGSVMWQDVFSFDNDWLEEQGIYDKKRNVLDEKLIISAIRNAMANLEEEENLNGMIWSAAIHYNTDNIHIHIASVELNPSREFGKRKFKTLKSMKSKFTNTLVDRSKEHKKINDLIRNNIIDKEKSSTFHKDRKMKKMINEIVKKLPKDKKQWKYNYNSMKEVRPLLYELSKYYIENYKKEEFENLNNLLDKEEEFFNKLYGDGKKENSKNNYKENKVNDLYTRLGNSFLNDRDKHN